MSISNNYFLDGFEGNFELELYISVNITMNISPLRSSFTLNAENFARWLCNLYVREINVNSFPTDATLTLNPDYQVTWWQGCK